MTLRKDLKKLDGDQCFVMSFPMIECGMTAVVDARISRHGEIKLVYCDATEERAFASDEILDKESTDQSLLEWCSCVQSQRQESEENNE